MSFFCTITYLNVEDVLNEWNTSAGLSKAWAWGATTICIDPRLKPIGGLALVVLHPIWAHGRPTSDFLPTISSTL